MQIDLSDRFYYDETSPSCLRWKINIYAGKHKNILIAAKDSPAGTMDKHYWFTKINRIKTPVHRIILKLFGHDTDGKLVDHINGNSFDNKISNLRVCSAKTNSQNKKMNSRNNTGVTGVCWRIEERKFYSKTYAKANWVENGSRRCKLFSVDMYGLLPAFKMAVEYRNKMIDKLNKNGNNYTTRHGTQV